MNKISIYGGLGNQMFQYALYRSLNQKGKKSELSFSGFLHYQHHNGFDLARAFKLKLPFQNTILKLFLLHCGFLYQNRYSRSAFRRLITWYDSKRNIYREKQEFIYDPIVFDQDNAFFVGVWQSEQYFADIIDVLQEEFIFNEPADETNKALAKKITSCNAVSLHIRRGDYFSADLRSSFGVIKDATYYINAMDYINARIDNPKYFIFSDDMQWVKDNINIPDCTYIDNNKGNESFFDMYLMSICKHNIIANSTFSWWGAQLNKNEDKIVVMPERWMNNNDCEGIFPNNWIKVKI